MKFKKILAVATVAAVSAASMVVPTSAADEYNAYISFQTATYSFRNPWDDTSYGADKDYYDNSIIVWDNNKDPDSYGEDNSDYFDYDIEGFLMPATYTNAKITGDGTYTVKVESDYINLNTAAAFNMIQVSTDIPYSEDISISDVSLKIDGADAGDASTSVIETNQTYILLSVVNCYNSDITLSPAIAEKSIEVTFTISGLGSGSSDEEQTEAPSAGDTDTDTSGTDKNTPDTGVEGVAVAAGAAIIAAGAIIVAKKRK